MPIRLEPFVHDPDASPRCDSAPPSVDKPPELAWLAVDLPVQLHYRFAERVIGVVLEHSAAVSRVCHAEAVCQQPLLWDREAGSVQLTIKLLVAGIEESGQGFLIAEDVLLRQEIGAAAAVRWEAPTTCLQSVAVDRADRRRVTARLTVSAWTCTLTRPARLRVEWLQESERLSPPVVLLRK